MSRALLLSGVIRLIGRLEARRPCALLPSMRGLNFAVLCFGIHSGLPDEFVEASASWAARSS